MINEYFKELNKLDDIYESFEIHSQLNNKIFNLDDNLMKQEIRQRLIEIADLFVSSMQENNVPIKVYDYWLVGSNAAYNYTKDSDIDIHIIVDMDIVADQYLLRLLYDYIKSSFSQKYNIMVKGHEVELYLEDIKTTAITNGIYSLKQDKWIKFPQEQEPRIIDIEETPLFAEWLDRYEHLEDEECEQFLDDLYVMRKISLANEGEFGTGNLVFKEFRNRGYLDDLKDRKYKFESDRLTLEKLEEASNEAKAGFGETQYQTSNVKGQNIDDSGLEPLPNNRRYIGHHILGIHKGPPDVVIPEDIHTKIGNEITNKLEDYYYKNHNGSKVELGKSAAKNKALTYLSKLNNFVDVSSIIAEIKKIPTDSNIQDILSRVKPEIAKEVFIQFILHKKLPVNQVKVLTKQGKEVLKSARITGYVEDIK